VPVSPEPELDGVTVMVTRPRDQGGPLCRRIEAAGGRAIHFSTVEILPAGIENDARQALGACAAGDLVIFVSRNAARSARRLCADLAQRLSGCGVFAIGEGTAAELALAGVVARIGGSGDYGSEALLRLPEFDAGQAGGKSVLIVRGSGGREYLREELARRGAKVRYAEVYRRAQPRMDARRSRKIWQDHRPDVIVATSIQGLEQLVNMTPEMFHPLLFATRLAVISPRVREHAVRIGFRAAIAVAPGAGDAGLFTAIQSAAGQDK